MKNGPVKKPYQKRYDPAVLAYVIDKDRIENKRHGQITPGSVVTVTAHFGPFRLIKDEAGTEWSVWKQALKPVKEKK